MLSDLRLTLRALAKSPGFAFVAVFTLALGIGVNTAIFSIVNAVVLRGLPFPDAGRLLLVRMANPAEGSNRLGVSQLDFADFRAQQKSFEDLAAYRDRTCTISGPGGDPERVSGVEMSASAAAMLRLPAHLGRWFTADEDRPGAPATVVLGYSLWENRFKANPAVVGQQLKVNGEWATVVGIGPKGNRFPEESDLWIPWRFSKIDEKRDDRYLAVFGRLKPEATEEQARAEITGLAQRLATDHPETNKNVIAQVRPFREGFIDDGTRQLMGIMFGAVFFVLLIACTNVANLLLSRAAIRQKEMAIRSALGAGRARLVRLLLTESLVLSVSGAAFGLGLAYGLMAVFNAYIQQKAPPYWMIFSIDGAVIGYAAVLVAVTCGLAGLFPAWRISRPDVNAVLKDGGRGSTNFALSRFTRLMVVGEVVLSCVLLVVSGLYVRSVIKMQTAGLGFQTAGIFTSRVALPEKDYRDAVKQRAFYHDLLERVAARPEIAAVAIADQQPTWQNNNNIVIDGKNFGEQTGRGGPRASFTAVSSEYFRTIGIAFLQGRGFTERDTAEADPVALVSSAFVTKYWPGENPIGKRFRQGSGRPGEEIRWLTVVGVVTPTLQGEFEGDVPPQAYIPHTQQKEMFRMTLFAKARGGDPAALAPVIRREVQALNTDLPIYFAQTFDHMIEDAKFFKRMFAWIFGIFGGVALVLAGVGLYGVMAYSVSQRTQEIGVRVALGASPRAVLGLILREGGLRLATGLVLGLGLGYGAARLQGDFLYGVQALDVPTFAGTFLTLGLAGVLACLVPALRALRVNPVEALRGE
jgi:predicted permease